MRQGFARNRHTRPRLTVRGHFANNRADIIKRAFLQGETTMSGPIVRTGTTPKFWQNWDQVFGKGRKKSTSGETKSSAAKPTKSMKKSSTKSAAGKKTKKTAGKKK
jgi:hypothetical protein